MCGLGLWSWLAVQSPSVHMFVGMLQVHPGLQDCDTLCLCQDVCKTSAKRFATYTLAQRQQTASMVNPKCTHPHPMRWVTQCLPQSCQPKSWRPDPPACQLVLDWQPLLRAALLPAAPAVLLLVPGGRCHMPEAGEKQHS